MALLRKKAHERDRPMVRRKMREREEIRDGSEGETLPSLGLGGKKSCFQTPSSPSPPSFNHDGMMRGTRSQSVCDATQFTRPHRPHAAYPRRYSINHAVAEILLPAQASPPGHYATISRPIRSRLLPRRPASSLMAFRPAARDQGQCWLCNGLYVTPGRLAETWGALRRPRRKCMR